MMDPRLPQLETALDAQAMLGILSSDWLVAPGRYQARACRIVSVRHRPGKSCLIRYDLSLHDVDGKADLRQVLCGHVHEQGNSEPRWRKALGQPLVNVGPGPAVAHIERLGLVLWAFPNERKLRGLQMLFDRRGLSEQVLPAILGEPVALVAEPELVRYVPEHGCTVKVRAALATGQLIVLYGKIQVSGAGEQVCAAARGLGRRAWYHGETRTFWQEEIPGAAAGQGDLDACARALAALHRHSLPGLTASAGLDEPGYFAAAARLLAGRAPDVDAIVAEIRRRRIPAPGTATLHGDVHLKNFLVHEGRAELIDLETLQTGNPLDDLGSFAASLYHRAALDGLPAAPVDRLVADFLRTYASLVPWKITARDIATYIAAALVGQRASRSVMRHKGDVVDQLLATGRRLLAETASARDIMNRFAAAAADRSGPLIDAHYKTFRKPQSWVKSYATLAWRDGDGIAVERIGPAPAAWRFPHDPAVPWMAGAADPVAVRAHLPVPAEEVEIEVLTYRPENRLTARYRVASGGRLRTIYGKTYSDERGYAVNDRLQQLARRNFLLPMPLGYSPAIKTVWQAAFEGVPVRSLVQGPHGDQLLGQAARQLRALHDSGIECPVRFTLGQMHEDLAKKIAKLAVVIPEAADRLDALVNRLGDALGRLPGASYRVVHGDFHVRQLMARGLDVALFDFDEAAWGDPVEDFGHFIADLYGDGFDDAFVASATSTLIDAYEASGGAAVDRGRLCWHTAYQLLTRAYRAMLQLKPDFDARIERHVQLAEALA